MKKYLVTVHNVYDERVLINPEPLEKKFFTVKGAMHWTYKKLRKNISCEIYADILNTKTGEVMIILER